MNKTDFLYRIGFQDGVNDHDNKLFNLSFLASSIDGSYLEGYKRGYEAATTKSWYIISLDKVTNEVNNYFIDLDEKGNDWTCGNAWTSDKERATKFPTREAATNRLSNFSCGRGNYGIIWE